MYRIVFTQQAQASAGASASLAPQPPQAVRVAQLASEIGELQSTLDAAQGIAQSRVVQQEIRQEIRNAERHVRDAERRVREARTDDQRGAAQQELFGARAELSALRGVAQAGPVIVHTAPAPPFPADVIPPQVVDISIAFFAMFAVIIIGWPLARAFGRRLERRADGPAIADPAMAAQLQRIEQAVDAMSIEIERISESQRFMAKLQNGPSPAAERSALGTGERR